MKCLSRGALFGALTVFLGAVSCFADQVASTSFKGLNNNENPVIIEPEYAQDLLNVNVTPGGKSVKKRSGYGLYKALSTSQAIHGGYHFFDSSGNDVQVWGSSTSLYGIVADATPTQLISSATLNSTWDCADSQASAYCVDSNRDTYLKTNGTTKNWYSTPLGTMVESTPDRMVVAGVSGTPNTLYISQSNTFTNFTTGVNATDAFTEVIASPGSKLTHIRWGCGKLLWWKDQSFGTFDFDNQYIAQVKTVSDTIGTFDNTSAIDPGGRVWFRGQDGHIWMYDCSFLTKQSIDITPNIQASGKRTANFWNQTSQSDWASGAVTFNGTSIGLSTITVVGDVVPSSITLVDTSSTDFNQGFGTNIDTTTTLGSVALKTNFSDTFSDFSNWTATNTTTCPLVFGVSGGVASCTTMSLQCCMAYTSKTINGDFVYESQVSLTGGSGSAILAAMSGSAGYCAVMQYGTGGTALYKVSNIQGSLCTTGTIIGHGNDFGSGSKRATLTRNSTTNVISFYLDDVLLSSGTDSTYTSFNTLYISGSNGATHDNIYDITRVGNFNSRAFDTAFSSPIYGTFTAGTSGTGSFAYAVRTSSNSATTYGADSTITSGSAITNGSLKRYSVYSATLTATTSAIGGPKLTDVTVIAASTGTFYSAVKNAQNISGWGVLTVNSQNNDGTHTFYMRSSTNSFTVGSSTPTWSSVTSGGLVSISTGTYFQLRDDFTITSGTQNPSLQDFTVNWFEGSATDQAYMLYFDNAIWSSVAFGPGQAVNNYIFKYDLINEGWTLYDFGGGGMLVQANTLYFGHTSAGNIFNYGTGTSDNGTAISAYWKSKDFSGADPFLQSSLTNVDTFSKKDQGSTLTVAYTMDTSTTTSYSMGLSNSTQSIIQSRKLLPSGKLGQVFNIKYSDSSTSSAWELFGFRVGFTQLPYRSTP